MATWGPPRFDPDVHDVLFCIDSWIGLPGVRAAVHACTMATGGSLVVPGEYPGSLRQRFPPGFV